MGTVKGLIARAYDELGYVEKASSSNLDGKTGNKGTNNYTKYSRDINALGLMGCQGQPWCATFQFWLEVQEFGPETALKHWNMTENSYVGYNCFDTYNKFKAVGRVSKTPKLGCLVIFTTSHMGRVVRIDGDTFWTIEGNTSSAKYDRNGGMVDEKSYKITDSKIKGFCIIDYDEEVEEGAPATSTSTTASTGNVAKGQEWLNDYYGDLLKKHCGDELQVDDSCGPKTRAAALCVWKDVVNRKYGFNLTPSNENFYSSCKKAAKKAQIKKGSSGTLVLIAKLLLSAEGYYTGKMSADFDSDLKVAVEAFQRARGLTVDGVIGSNTWYALFN